MPGLGWTEDRSSTITLTLTLYHHNSTGGGAARACRGTKTVGVSARMAPGSPTRPMATSSQRLRPAHCTRGAPPSSSTASRLRARRDRLGFQDGCWKVGRGDEAADEAVCCGVCAPAGLDNQCG